MSNEHCEIWTPRVIKRTKKKKEKNPKRKDYTKRLNVQDQEEISVRTLRSKSGKNVLNVRTPLMGKIYRLNTKKENER